MGVRMFVAELTQSFKGISDKILKGSVPAVDCVVTFNYSIQAPTYGFIFGLLGQVIAIVTLILLKSPVLIISGFICLFIDNGTLAVYANKAGGRSVITSYSIHYTKLYEFRLVHGTTVGHTAPRYAGRRAAVTHRALRGARAGARSPGAPAP